jgi:polysaccharide pyruvyl transferase WcaK-like protein
MTRIETTIFVFIAVILILATINTAITVHYQHKIKSLSNRIQILETQAEYSTKIEKELGKAVLDSTTSTLDTQKQNTELAKLLRKIIELENLHLEIVKQKGSRTIEYYKGDKQ